MFDGKLSRKVLIYESTWFELIMSQEIEKQLFFQFIAPNRKDRFFWHIESKKRRRNKLFDDLRDIRHFKEELCKEVDSPAEIIKFLKLEAKAKTLYIISSDEAYDAKEVNISELQKIDFWNANEIIGFDIKSRKGFFVNHESWFYVLG